MKWTGKRPRGGFGRRQKADQPKKKTGGVLHCKGGKTRLNKKVSVNPFKGQENAKAAVRQDGKKVKKGAGGGRGGHRKRRPGTRFLETNQPRTRDTCPQKGSSPQKTPSWKNKLRGPTNITTSQNPKKKKNGRKAKKRERATKYRSDGDHGSSTWTGNGDTKEGPKTWGCGPGRQIGKRALSQKSAKHKWTGSRRTAKAGKSAQ